MTATLEADVTFLRPLTSVLYHILVVVTEIVGLNATTVLI